MALFGRDADVARVVSWLDEHDEDARVLSVAGPVGVGASRLLEEIARRVKEREPERVVVRCATEGDPVDAVAAALGAPDARGVAAALAQGDAPVLLLDGGAPAAIKEAIGPWLEAVPDLSIIAAAGAPLRVPGESVIELKPLEPDAALALFCDASRRAGAEVPERDRVIAAEIVRELDGLPLAIELAAARMPVFGARALLHRLRTQPPAPALERALEAAWRSLDDAQREALARASVLRGPFDLETAEAVLALPDVAGLLAALRERSLLFVDAPGTMRVWAAVRAFARSQMDDAAREAARQRHAEHFAARAAAADRAWLVRAREDLLAVVQGALEARPVTPRRAAPALGVLVAALPVLFGASPIGTWRALVDPVLRATQASGVDGLLLARVLAVRGALRRHEGARAGVEDLVRALGTIRALPSRAGERAREVARAEADVLVELGRALADAGEGADALEHFERALALAERGGDLLRQGDAYAGEAGVLHRRLELAQAAALLERAEVLHERDPLASAEDLRALAEARLDQGDHTRARAAAERASTLARAHGDRRGDALARAVLGAVLLDAGDPRAARVALEEAAALLGDLGLTRDRAGALARLGVLARIEGRVAEAYALLSEAVAHLGEADREAAAVIAAHLAALEDDVGRGERARAAIAGLSAALDRARMPVAAHVLLVVAARIEGRDLGPTRAAVEAVASSSATVRAALRCGARSAKASVAPPDALVVAEDGRWFQAPKGERVSLERRRPLARVLATLARARLDAPGRAVTTAELLASAWAGEKVLAAAGAHRVRVGVATLRKMGLKDALRTAGDGYLLDPSQPILLA